MTIAESLRRFRKNFNLTQKQVATVLNISQQSYQVYEKQSIPSAAIILKLADAFKVSADYLLGRIDSPNGINAENSAVNNVDELTTNNLAIAAKNDRVLDFYENLAHKLAQQGIQI